MQQVNSHNCFWSTNKQLQQKLNWWIISAYFGLFSTVYLFGLPDVQVMNVEDDASLRKNYAALKEKTDVEHEKGAQGILP